MSSAASAWCANVTSNRRATLRGIGHPMDQVRADSAATPGPTPPHLRRPPGSSAEQGDMRMGRVRGAISSRIDVGGSTMENVRNRSVWMSKLRTVVIASFAVTAGAAGRVMADPTVPAPSTADDAGIARRVVAVNRTEEPASAAVKGKRVSAAVWQLADPIRTEHADLEQNFQDLAGGGSESGGETAVDERTGSADRSR